MSTPRMIKFETTSEKGAGRVNEAPGSAFGILAKEAPDGVCLTYWRDQGRRRFPALIELTDDGSNPLMDIEATRDLPRVTGECVEGGYPSLEVAEKVGSYGLVS